MADGHTAERARQPEDLDRLFLERANAGDVNGVVELYKPQAVLAFHRASWPSARRRSGRSTRACWPEAAFQRRDPPGHPQW